MSSQKKYVYVVIITQDRNDGFINYPRPSTRDPVIHVFENEKDALEMYDMYAFDDGKKYTINDGSGESPGEISVDWRNWNHTVTIQKKEVTVYDEEEHRGHDWGYQ